MIIEYKLTFEFAPCDRTQIKAELNYLIRRFPNMSCDELLEIAIESFLEKALNNDGSQIEIIMKQFDKIKEWYYSV